jgi:hypothetical protein
MAGPQTGQATLAQAPRLPDHPGLIDVLTVKPAEQASISRQKRLIGVPGWYRQGLCLRVHISHSRVARLVA